MKDKLNKSIKSYLTKKMIGITNHFFDTPVISPVVNDAMYENNKRYLELINSLI